MRYKIPSAISVITILVIFLFPVCANQAHIPTTSSVTEVTNYLGDVLVYWARFANVITRVKQPAPVTPGSTPGSSPKPTPILDLSLETSNYWMRGSDDLPVCVYDIAYSVSNRGTAEAKDVSLTLNVGGSSRSLGSTSLKAGQAYTGSTKVQLKDGIYDIEMEARSATSSASDRLRAFVIFPRDPQGQPEIMKLYITPNNPDIRDLVKDIVESRPLWLTPRLAVQQWITLKIEYRSDSSVHGESEYWQLPTETFELRSGDCEDFAILLCTMLRITKVHDYKLHDDREGLPADMVYVMIGEDSQGNRHAYLAVSWFSGHMLWKSRGYRTDFRVIEPELSGFPIISDLADLELALRFTELYAFNDVYYLNSEELKALSW